MEYTVTVEQLIQEFNLTTLTENTPVTGRHIHRADINRLALQLTGYFEYFEHNRVQIIGLVEHSYIKSLSAEVRNYILGKLFKFEFPCVIVTRSLMPCPEFLRIAEENLIPVLSSSLTTSEFMGEMLRWIRLKLAPRMTVHGVLVDIYGEGILIMGESGIGKSELALELIERGHRFVADDAVEIKRVSAETLVGSCPDVLKYFIELRGVGIIDIMKMFGVQSIKATQSIDLVIKLETWEKGKEYDRLGLNDNYANILGNNIVCNIIPVRPGRNLAVICESAAINNRQKKMGYNPAKLLGDRVDQNAAKKLSNY